MTDLDRVRRDDPFLLQYQPSDLRIASEFLTTWLPFLSRDLCQHCTQILSDRIRSLEPVDAEAEPSHSDTTITPVPLSNSESHENCLDDNCDNNSSGSWKDGDGDDMNSLGSWKDEANGWSESVSEASTSGILGAAPLVEAPSHRMSWADMAQEDEFEEEQTDLNKRMVNTSALTGEMKISRDVEKPKLSRDQREYIRFMSVKRKKDFICLERVKGKIVNILEGLELHSLVFSAVEQTRIVNYVHELQELGSKGKLKERTYTAPQKWMRGKGRVTIQFGCCYNYATDKNGNPPGILQNEIVDPIPKLFKVIIRRLIKWHVLPPTCVPDSCIVNIYDKGDCIPPHIDNHDFVRPFCTVSFVSECNIVFGTNLKVVRAGEFTGSIAIPLPVGSVLVLNGNAADVSKHCVPSVTSKRISITFRKMDDEKRPIGFVPEPDLQGIEPLAYDMDKTKRLKSPMSEPYGRRQTIGKDGKMDARGFGENGSQSEPRYSTRSRRGSANKWRVR
ncbi:RNA demethylase ALKBH9B isoform X2 [Hevea brasiliensis]|uniref:RNA demethylase ALKBH9B isoform X2 n=1 Tax=Hevea brasiliensis TaxID=3981 RepID=UPI0025FD5B92|nr:RNA demethylase ALKBH9B isoform X2 [Hevea brasiliensis]